MEVAKTTADGLAQIRILAEVNRKDKNRVNSVKGVTDIVQRKAAIQH